MLIEKKVVFGWDQQREALVNIKTYLTKPSFWPSPCKGKPLILYIPSLDQSLGALLAEENVEDKGNTLYYLSLTLIDGEKVTP